MQKITLYTVAYSRGDCASWMLEECGADYERVALQFDDSIKSPDYLAINPMGKVPALKYGDTIITELSAIVMFLADLFPEKNLIPAVGTAERGELYRWMFFSINFEYALMDKLFNRPLTDEQERSIGYGNFDTALNTLTNFIAQRQYAIGDHFTVLDLYLSGLIGWWIYIKIIPEEGVLADYIKRHLARPAYAKIQALNSTQTTQ